MKGSITAVLATFIIFGSQAAYAFGCEARPVFSTAKGDGSAVGLVLSSSQMADTPAWSPTEGEPPLSISEASRIAIEWAEAEYTRYDSVEIFSIDLNRYQCSSPDSPNLRSRWYYNFSFSPVIDGNRLFGGGNFAAVLMDGTVVGPQPVERRF